MTTPVLSRLLGLLPTWFWMNTFDPTTKGFNLEVCSDQSSCCATCLFAMARSLWSSISCQVLWGISVLTYPPLNRIGGGENDASCLNSIRDSAFWLILSEFGLPQSEYFLIVLTFHPVLKKIYEFKLFIHAFSVHNLLFIHSSFNLLLITLS